MEGEYGKGRLHEEISGLTLTWDSLDGRTIESVTPIKGTVGAAVLVFDDGSVRGHITIDPGTVRLAGGITPCSPSLEPKHPQAYVEYDRLAAIDKAAQRPPVWRIFSVRFTTTSPISPSSKIG